MSTFPQPVRIHAAGGSAIHDHAPWAALARSHSVLQLRRAPFKPLLRDMVCSLHFLILAFTVSPLAFSQTVYQAASAASKPYVSRSENGIVECGIQVKVVDTGVAYTDQYTLVLSVSPDDNFGVIQGGRLRLSATQL